jgi:hypothetical protein
MTCGVLLLSTAILYGCEGLAITDTSSLLLPRFHRSEVFGFLAGLGTTFAALPDLFGMLKRRSSKASTREWRPSPGCFKSSGSITVS